MHGLPTEPAMNLLSERGRILVALLAFHDRDEDPSNRELSKYLGISRTHLQNYMNTMVELGFVRRKRRGRRIFYEVLAFPVADIAGFRRLAQFLDDADLANATEGHPVVIDGAKTSTFTDANFAAGRDYRAIKRR